MGLAKKGSTSDGFSAVAASRREGKVDVEELLDFIFPKSLQHPLSTGRLYAFGMYGPLDSDGKLRSGHNGHRVVGTWEIDTMCLQFEREDILQVGERYRSYATIHVWFVRAFLAKDLLVFITFIIRH